MSNTTPENPHGSTSSKATENLVTRSGSNSVSPPSLDVSSQSTEITDEIIVPIGTKTNTDENASNRNIPSPEILLPDNKLITSLLPVPEQGNKSDIPADENITSDNSQNANNESTVSNGTANRTDATDTVKPPALEIGRGADPADKQGTFLDFDKTVNSDSITKSSTCMNQGTTQQPMTSGISSDTRNTAPANSQSCKYFIICSETS